jgi:hypothetical protein
MEKVTRVDLSKFMRTNDEMVNALIWMIENQGPICSKRRFRDLTVIEFEDDREATFFILKWS